MAERTGTFKDRDGDRWYRSPSNPTASYAGVTSCLNARNKVGINKAKVNGVAKYAAANRKILANMTQAGAIALLKSEDETLPDWSVGREFGTATDLVIKDVLLGQPIEPREVEGTDSYPVKNDFHEWAPQYWSEFQAQHNVKVILPEATVYSHQFGYAGSMDMLLEVDGVNTIVDLKTNKNGPHGDVGLQNRAYASADEIVDVVTGETRPLPPIERSGVLWMREEGWGFYPLKFDEDVFRAFFACLVLFQFSKIGEHEMIGERLSGTIDFKRWIP